MTYRVRDLQRVAEDLWPISGAEEWDACGLVSGDPAAEISRIHLTVDVVADTVDEAIELGSHVLVAHHPLLLRGAKSVAEDRYKGSILARLIRGNCALLTAHTNADIVADGVSAVMAARLGLVDTAAIRSTRGTPPARVPDVVTGLGRTGRLPQPTTLGVFARALAAVLPATASGVRVSGDYDAPVERVSLCGGAGDSLLAEPAVGASDVFITSDLRHHPASEAREQAKLAGGPALIDVSHWASEWLWLESAAASLRAAFPDATVTVSDIRTDPWDFTIVQ